MALIKKKRFHTSFKWINNFFQFRNESVLSFYNINVTLFSNNPLVDLDKGEKEKFPFKRFRIFAQPTILSTPNGRNNKKDYDNKRTWSARKKSSPSTFFLKKPHRPPPRRNKWWSRPLFFTMNRKSYSKSTLTDWKSGTRRFTIFKHCSIHKHYHPSSSSFFLLDLLLRYFPFSFFLHYYTTRRSLRNVF